MQDKDSRDGAADSYKMAITDESTAMGENEPKHYDNDMSETAPFISTGPLPAQRKEDDDGGDLDDPRKRYRWPVVALTFSIVFAIELAMGVSNPAWNALIERGICAEIHPGVVSASLVFNADGTLLDEALCKDPDVQGTLAMYRGWTYMLEALPTILLAVPYGALSDRWGRKPVGVLCVLGILLTMIWYQVVFYFSLPMWTTLVDGLWFFVGGGIPVGVSMLYTMLADVVPVDEMASVLFRFNSVFLVGELVSNPLGGLLLDISPWLSLAAGNAFMLFAFAGFYFLPETLAIRQWHDAQAGRLLAQQPSDGGMDDDDNSLPHREKHGRARVALGAATAQVRDIWEFLVTNKRVSFLILPFVFVSLGKYVQELLLQYATKRYGWSWSEASYFMTIKSASFILMLTLILPLLSTHLSTRRHFTPLARDLHLSRWSGAVLVLADLVITLSATPLLFALGLVLLAGGCGLPPLLRSLLNALVEPRHVGRLNTAVGFLETLGIMLAAPVFSWAMQTGIELGGGWIGLPFAAGTGIACVAAVLVFGYRLPRGEAGDGDLVGSQGVA